MIFILSPEFRIFVYMENHDLNIISDLFVGRFGASPVEITQLEGAGSSRRYYRLTGNDGNHVIATVGNSAHENDAFIMLDRHFIEQGIRVPEILAVSDDCMAYLQIDLGDTSLFDLLAGARKSGEWGTGDVRLLEAVVKDLADIQFDGVGEIDFSKCYPLPSLDRRGVMWDLNYFKYCFLKAVRTEIDEPRLEAEFEKIADSVLSADVPSGFMYRDFQSRNVMVSDCAPWYIDFQGGRRGPCLYDIVSFLWQARAAYPDTVRGHLLDVYFKAVCEKTGISEKTLRIHLPDFVLFRTLQVLGAYGFRGYFERKAHFIKSIDPALRNLDELLENCDFPHLPYIREVMRSVIEAKKRKETEQRTTLRVKVVSFSYKVGYPVDDSGNGGGFVFDCRAVTNPGRFDQYKPLTGLDRPVIDFIESTDEMQIFLDNAFALVSASVRRYLERGFTDLSVAFGCTGGRHRSVYAAQHMAERINRELGVEVELCHRERNIRSIFPAR